MVGDGQWAQCAGQTYSCLCLAASGALYSGPAGIQVAVVQVGQGLDLVLCDAEALQ